MTMRSDARPRRLHPASILFRVGGAARAYLIPGLVVLLASGNRDIDVWLMVLFVPGAAIAVIQYFAYGYELAGPDLVIRSGVLTRNERHIPFARIQSIDTSQNPLHRLLGVAEVRIQTASGAEPEAVMRVLSLEAVEEIRARVDRRIGADRHHRQESHTVIAELSPRDVLVFGLLSNRGMTVVLAALGAAWQLDLPISESVKSWGDRVATITSFDVDSPVGATAALLTVAIAAVVVLRVLSIGWALYRFFGFRLVRDAHGTLRTEAGLFTRTSATIPLRRLQTITIHESLLQRIAGRYSIIATTAGSTEKEAATAGREWLVPFADRDTVDEVLRLMSNEVSLASEPWQPVSHCARQRLAARGLFVVVGCTGLALPVLPAAAIAAIGVIATTVVLMSADRRARSYGWRLGRNWICVKKGWLTRDATFVRFDKIQAVARTTTPFDRRHRTEVLLIDSAGGNVGRRPRLPFLDRAVSERLAHALVSEAARRRFRW